MSAVFLSHRPDPEDPFFVLVVGKEDFYDVTYRDPPLRPLNDAFPNVLIAGNYDGKRNPGVWMGMTVSPLFMTAPPVVPSHWSRKGRKRKAANKENKNVGDSKTKGKSETKPGDTALQDETPVRDPGSDGHNYEQEPEVTPGKVAVIIPHCKGRQLNSHLQEMQDELSNIRHHMQLTNINERHGGLQNESRELDSNAQSYTLKGELTRLTEEDEADAKRKKKLERIVVSFLTDENMNAKEYLQKLCAKASKNGRDPLGYNLLIGDVAKELYFYNDRDRDNVYDLEPGEFSFDSSSRMGQESARQPRMKKMSEKFREIIDEMVKGRKNRSGAVAEDNIQPGDPTLFHVRSLHRIWKILEDETPYSRRELVNTGLDMRWEEKLSPMLVRTGVYGTRQTLILSLSKREPNEDENVANRHREIMEKMPLTPYHVGLYYKHYHVPDLSFMANIVTVIPETSETESSEENTTAVNELKQKMVDASVATVGSNILSLEKTHTIAIPANRDHLLSCYSASGKLSKKMRADSSMVGQHFFELQKPQYPVSIVKKAEPESLKSEEPAQMKAAYPLGRPRSSSDSKCSDDENNAKASAKRGADLREQDENQMHGTKKIPISQLIAKPLGERKKRK